MAEPSGHPRSVLVIDDDPLMRELLVALLEMEGITVEAAASGEEALALLTGPASAPEVVLTDLQMPGTDFMQFAPKLRAARGSGAALLGMSGSPAEPEELALLDGFLLKPFTTEEFLAAIGQAQCGEPQVAQTGAAAGASVHRSETASPVLDQKVYDRMAASMKPAVLAELYRITLEDVRQRTAAMRTAHAAGDYDACRREAHAIKGGCGMVGAMDLRAKAAALEAGSPADGTALATMEEACKALQGMLDARL